MLDPDKKHASDYNSIVERIHFDRDTGRVWLDESQMLFFDRSFFCDLRQVLIDCQGIKGARGVLTRLGYLAGFKHAELSKKLRKNVSDHDAFMLGPQLTMVSGIASVDTLVLEVDYEAGKFYGEFKVDSFECESYIESFGQQHESTCWYLSGYASGFTSGFMDKQILVKEVDCCAIVGDVQCKLVAKPVEEWHDVADELSYYEPLHISEQLHQLQHQVDGLREQLKKSTHPVLSSETIGVSPSFLKTCNLIKKAAGSRVTVLLLGETGVGKEKFARAVHELSPRDNKPFVAINCAAIPPSLLEAELFGVEAGAFTGANRSRAGHFERANGGTLFLDEVGELSSQAQASLLRVLQEGELMRVGGDHTKQIDVRLVAATNQDLTQLVADGHFRADLLYRLNIYPVTIPPLRQRVEDISLLAEHFLEKCCVIHNKNFKGFSDRAMLMLKQHPWPGNVRELENMVERGVILAENQSFIEITDLFVNADALTDSSTVEGQDESQWANRLLDSGCDIEKLEFALIDQAMDRTKGNVAKAARLLGISRPTLAYRLKKINTQ